VADVMSDGPHEAAPLLTVAGAAQVGAHRWRARSLFPVSGLFTLRFSLRRSGDQALTARPKSRRSTESGPIVDGDSEVKA
jgi:hypothetical protein